MKIGKNCTISPKASIYGGGRIELGDNVRIDDFTILTTGRFGYLKIGSHVHIASRVSLYAGEGLILEDFVQISPGTTIMTQSDEFLGECLIGPQVPDKYRGNLHKGSMTIGKHTIIGAHSFVMPGVQIGEGVAIGAGSLVNKDCNPWKIYLGSPIRTYGPRSKVMLELEKQFLDEYTGGSI